MTKIAVISREDRKAACLNCDSTSLCDAHIIPKSFGRDIIKASKEPRRNLTLLAPDRKGSSQSGFSDRNILCHVCDGILGKYDKEAVEITRLAETDCELIDSISGSFTITSPRLISHHKLALFAAAVVWRASNSTLIDFSLGSNEKWFRGMIFRETEELPTVSCARLYSSNHDKHLAAMNAMMYPVRIRSENGLSFAKFYVKGFMFLVQTSRRHSPLWEDGSVVYHGKSKGNNTLTGVLMPFEQLAELAQAKDSIYVKEVLAKPI